MKVILAALGGGSPDTITAQCEKALKEARRIIGAKRLLEKLPEDSCTDRVAAVRPEEILKAVTELGEDEGSCAVVYSGDTGFYSGARLLIPFLEKKGIPFLVIPGISSVQLLSARLLRPWQDWKLVSAHGTSCNITGAFSEGKPVFFLSGGRGTGVSQLCARIAEAGFPDLKVTVGERLSYPEERITEGTALSLSSMTFDSLAVMLAEPAPLRKRRCPGFPDEAFLRGDVPMTKQEVRAAILGKLAVGPEDVLWDVGAGTGSVSVELALAAPSGQVYGVECNQEACELIRKNREKFGARNLNIVEGKAPEVLSSLPKPDGIFIGGTKGNMEGIIECALKKNPDVKICISAIALETLSRAVSALTDRGLKAEVTQISVSRSKDVGRLHLMMANNPVFLITGECNG